MRIDTPIPSTSGTDTYLVSFDPTLTSYVTNQIYFVKFGNANTGAVTLNVNGLGAKSIVKNGSTALASGNISANQILSLTYDGTNFQLISFNPMQEKESASWYADSSTTNPADNSVYCNGVLNNLAFTSSNAQQMTCTKNNAIFTISWHNTSTGVIGTSEGATIRIYNVTQGTNEILTTTHVYNKRVTNSFLRTTLAFNSGDLFYLEITNPTWVTNPTGVYTGVTTRQY